MVNIVKLPGRKKYGPLDSLPAWEGGTLFVQLKRGDENLGCPRVLGGK